MRYMSSVVQHSEGLQGLSSLWPDFGGQTGQKARQMKVEEHDCCSAAWRRAGECSHTNYSPARHRRPSPAQPAQPSPAQPSPAQLRKVVRLDQELWRQTFMGRENQKLCSYFPLLNLNNFYILLNVEFIFYNKHLISTAAMRAKQKIDIFVHPLKGCYNGRCVINQQFDIVGVMGIELQMKIHTKVCNHGEGPYQVLLLVVTP